MCQNLKKYQLVTEENIADTVVMCANMPEDIKSFIVLDLMDKKKIGNTNVGLTGYEMKLFLAKMKKLGLYSKTAGIEG